MNSCYDLDYDLTGCGENSVCDGLCVNLNRVNLVSFMKIVRTLIKLPG